MNDRTYLREGCAQLVELTSDWVSRASSVDWSPQEGSDGEEALFRLSLVSIVVKQFESLQSILFLDEHLQGYSAVPLLRAMCEELIWVRFLATIPEAEQATILVALTATGIHDALKAQDGNGIPNPGFDPAWRNATESGASASEQRLRDLFKGHGFSLRGKSITPSVAQIAKRGGMERTYRYLYHATSRFVHFSPAELVRRIWGKPGQMNISSKTFERYWSAFALYWRGWLYSLTFAEALLILQEPDIEDSVVEGVGKAAELLKSRGAVPLLTTQEVSWPF